MSVERRGTVTEALVSPGSKSERHAVVLDSEGERYVLRRVGGDPFSDSVIEGLVGKQLRAVGVVHGANFFMTHWSEIDS
jgi:hypothetical protein